MREQSIVGNYYRLAPKKRLDVIVLHYDGFPAMMKDYENELQDWILISRARARQEALGDLGVRVQTGKANVSVTENSAFENIKVEEIMKAGNRAQEYKDGRDMANELLRRSRILAVCGEADTEEMLEDIALAKRLRIAATTLEGILTIDNKAASSKPKKR